MQDATEGGETVSGFPMDMLNELMSGNAIVLGFSGGTLGIVLALMGLSIGVGITARRFIFPKLMDILSKTERIDGKSLMAPKSLGWMIGFLAFSKSLAWIDQNTEPVWDAALASNLIDWSFTLFVMGLLLAAYRLVDYLDAFIDVEGEANMASRRSLASVAGVCHC